MVVNRPGSVPTLQTVACFGAAGATAGAIITAIACQSSRWLFCHNLLTSCRSLRIDEAICANLGSHGEE